MLIMTIFFIYGIISLETAVIADKIWLIFILLFLMYTGIIEGEKLERKKQTFREGHFNLAWKVILFAAITYAIRLIVERVVL